MQIQNTCHHIPTTQVVPIGRRGEGTGREGVVRCLVVVVVVGGGEYDLQSRIRHSHSKNPHSDPNSRRVSKPLTQNRDLTVKDIQIQNKTPHHIPTKPALSTNAQPRSKTHIRKTQNPKPKCPNPNPNPNTRIRPSWRTFQTKTESKEGETGYVILGHPGVLLFFPSFFPPSFG